MHQHIHSYRVAYVWSELQSTHLFCCRPHLFSWQLFREKGCLDRIRCPCPLPMSSLLSFNSCPSRPSLPCARSLCLLAKFRQTLLIFDPIRGTSIPRTPQIASPCIQWKSMDSFAGSTHWWRRWPWIVYVGVVRFTHSRRKKERRGRRRKHGKEKRNSIASVGSVEEHGTHVSGPRGLFLVLQPSKEGWWYEWVLCA
jgi:hypothetical protein